jgi:hypothetical protein
MIGAGVNWFLSVAGTRGRLGYRREGLAIEGECRRVRGATADRPQSAVSGPVDVR